MTCITEEGLVKRFQFDLEMGRYKEYSDFDEAVCIFKFTDKMIYNAFKNILTKMGYKCLSEHLVLDYIVGIAIDIKYKCWRQLFINESEIYRRKNNKVPKYIVDYSKGELKRYYDWR